MRILISSIIDLEKTTNSRLHHFLSHLVSHGHKITVISIKDPWKHKGEKHNLELLKNIEVHYLTNGSSSIVLQKGKAVFHISRLLKGIDLKRIDVHLSYNSLMINYLLSKHLKKHGIRTVYDLADHLPDMIRTNPQVPWLLRPVAGFVAGKLLDSNLRNASAVTVSAKDLIEGMELGKYNVKYIPNGVDLKRFRPRKDKHKGVIIGYVGALREWVDLRPMLIAVKALTGYKLRVLVVGGESDLPQYRDFVKKNGMEKLVTFTGNVPFDEIPKYINMMDITTVPFRKNKVTDGTCPLKLLEYLACEKPAICSRLNEIESMLANRVLYADTAREWEKQISTLYHDEILRETLGKQGREYVQEHFDWKIICEDMEKVLEANSKEG